MHGHGKMITPRGEAHEGEWDHGKEVGKAGRRSQPTPLFGLMNSIEEEKGDAGGS